MSPAKDKDSTTNQTFELTDGLRVFDPHSFEAELTLADGLVVRCPELGERTSVSVVPCYPITDWGRFISFTDEDGEELGLIEDIRALAPGSKDAVARALDEQHFLPIITRVLSISREFHIPIWEVETDRGTRTFACKGRHAAQRMGSGRFYVRDADGNGYLIPDVSQLDIVSRRLVEINT